MSNCLKCLNKTPGSSKKLKLPDMLSHLVKYTVCGSCKDKASKSNYKKNSKYYKKIQSKYRKELSDQYIKRLIADRTILKPNEVPDNLVTAKRQHLQIKKLTKEE